MKPFSIFTGRLNAKVALMSAASILLTATALVLLSSWQSGQYNILAQNEVNALIAQDLDHITQGVYNLVHTENVAVQAQVDNHLSIARYFLTASGSVSLSQELVAWEAFNQFSRDIQLLHLPKFLIGGQWLGKNSNLDQPSPVVDEVIRLLGDSATIFQRMNEQGDMLRVATTVRTESGERAIGTYIPAVNPEGTPNPVISAILRGERYQGRAFVVNDWYLTTYEPIHDQSNELVGMLYTGVKQAAVAARIRNAILQTTVGKTGYVYVLGGVGEERGRYIISHRGQRDGEDVWYTQDSDGRYVIREIIETATRLKAGEMATVRYRWQNPDEPAPRWKIARLAYYQPWDWVIGTSVYEDELQAYSNLLKQGRIRNVHFMTMAGAGITLLVGLLAMLATWALIRPVRAMTEAARMIMAGDLDTMVTVKSHDEIGVLAETFNSMTSQLRNTLQELTKSEEKYRGIFENAIEGLYQSTIDGRFVNANPACAQILGFDSPREMVEKITDIRTQVYANPEDRDTFLAQLSRHKSIVGYEVEYLRRDGSRIWVSISGKFQEVEQGAPQIIEGFINDISDRKKAEEALAESKNYLDGIINSIGDPIFVKDKHNRLVLVNTALCTLAELDRHRLVGHTLDEIFPHYSSESMRKADEQVLNSGCVAHHEQSLTDAKGRLRTIVTKKSLYTDKRGEVFIVGVIRDITDLKHAEAERLRLETQLIQSQKMEAIGTLAGGIAHDFNNILQPMLGYSEMLRLRLAKDSPLQKYVDQLHAAGLRARELVNQILTFSRQSERKIGPIHIQTILMEALKLCRATIPANIMITGEIDQSCPPVLIDPGQLHQVIMNLLINAYHAMENAKGEITVRLNDQRLGEQALPDTNLSPGHYICFSVIDNGCGIDSKVLGKIFDPYFTTKKQGQGTGLGLAMVYGIVKECGGHVLVRSELGHGTEVTVYLPVSNQEPEDVHAEEETLLSTGNEHILLVDDDAMVLEMNRHILENLGYRLTACQSSQEALAIFTQDPTAFDLLLTDFSMPDMTGDQLTTAVLSLRPNLPVILCSGFSEQLGDVYRLGARAVLMKPASISAISRKVRTVLDSFS